MPPLSERQLRRLVHARDLGRCAVCLIDCDAIARRLAPGDGPFWLEHKKARGVRLLERLWGVSLQNRLTFWDMDHIVPQVFGGPDELSNLRTLCRRCHHKETVRLQKSLAAARRFYVAPDQLRLFDPPGYSAPLSKLLEGV